MLKKILVAGTLVLALASVRAQDPGQLILTGTVTDSASREPIDFLTVHLLSDQNIATHSTLTRNGRFFLPLTRPFNGQIVAEGMGYKPSQRPVNIPDGYAGDTLDIGELAVAAGAFTLETVDLTATRPIVRTGLGMVTYDVLADPSHTGRNVLEMLPGVPFVSVNGAGEILLKGGNGFRWLLNGRPSGALERDPAGFLRSLPASSVQRIEVITTPPAKYEAEGLNGLINVVTLRREQSGYNGSLNHSYRFPVGGPGLGGAMTLRKGKGAFSAYGGGKMEFTPVIPTTYQRLTLLPEAGVLTQESEKKGKDASAYGGGEWSWERNKQSLFSGHVNVYGNQYQGQTRQNTRFAQGADSVRYVLANETTQSGIGGDAGMGWQYAFPKHKGRTTTLAYRYSFFSKDLRPEVTFSGQSGFAGQDFRQMNAEWFGEHTAQADYVHPLKQAILELGAKAILRTNQSNYDYLAQPSPGEPFVPVPEKSDGFDYRQRVYSLYGNYLFQGEKISLSAGLRFELTQAEAAFLSSQTQASQLYLNAIPNLMANYNLKKGSIQAGFSQRIRRPNIVRLNPFEDQTNPNVTVSGNPNLRPVVLNNLMLGYNLNGNTSLNVGLGYNFFNNLDLRVYELDPSGTVTRITYANTGSGSSPGLDVYVARQLGKKFNLSLNGNVMYFDLSGAVQSTEIRNTWWTAYGAPRLQWDAGSGWRFFAGLNLTSASPSSFQGTQNGFFSSELGVNKSLLKDRLAVSVNVANPLRTYRDQILIVDGPGFTEEATTREYFRSVNFSLNYNFGDLKDGVKKTRKSIRNDDVKN